jgi:hypothetical protein
LVHWFDFIADSAVEEENARILKAPPKVIAFLEMPDLVWILHERLFRGGQVLKQRALRATILRLVNESGVYELEASYDVQDNCKLWIWTRRN